MAATYINGNTFKVDFILWRKDIVSYFWYTYFFHPTQFIFKADTKRFFHALVYAVFLTVTVGITAYILHIENLIFFIFYFPVLLTILVFLHYKQALKTTSSIMGRQYTFTIEENTIQIKDNDTKRIMRIEKGEVISIIEKRDMLIIYTNQDEFILPTRVLSYGQIESVLAFK